MGKLNFARIGMLACLALALFLLVRSESIVIRAVTACLLLGLVVLLLRLQKKRQHDAYNERLLRILSLYRHDWMNHIQVLLGYIRLGKHDRLQDYMGKIKGKVHQESYLAKMGVGALAVYYYTFQAENRSLLLEFEMEQEIRLSRLPAGGTRAAAFIQELIELFASEVCLERSEPAKLSIAFEEEADHILLDVIYEGETADLSEGKWKSLFRRYRKDDLVVEQERTEGGLTLSVRLPFQPK